MYPIPLTESLGCNARNSYKMFRLMAEWLEYLIVILSSREGLVIVLHYSPPHYANSIYFIIK